MEVKELTERLFEQYPVWKWNDSMDSHCPVEKFDPLPENEHTLFIKASFETPVGMQFSGYLIGTKSFYAFGLFIEGQVYVMNLNLPEMIDEDIASICTRLGRTKLDLFPLKYETKYHFFGKPMIAGTLRQKEG